MNATILEVAPLQRTLPAPISFRGTGLHTGRDVCATIHPAQSGHGIVFVRTDLAGSVPIPARLENVVRTTLATTLGINGTTIGTVEHLIAALHGLEVDNVLVEVDGPELPGMDGSARPFVEAIEGAGLVTQSSPRTVLRVVDTVEAHDPETGRWSRISPHDGFVIDCEIAFDHPLLGRQQIRFEGGPRSFAAEIAPARTFGMLADVEAMHAAGLALGGALDNSVVFSATDVINPGGLRFSDECVRHKVLDMIGDLALLGAPVIGEFSASRSGHAFNLALVRRALERGALQPQEARSQAASG